MKTQKGFTLVEIAIVLVIVGLLLGGVLKGSELIENARVRNVIQQTEEMQAAVFAFQDRFSALPGDISNASNLIGGTAVDCSTACDNGLIQQFQNSSLVTNHLSAAGFFSGETSNTELGNANAYIAAAPKTAYGGAVLVAFWNEFNTAPGVRSTTAQNGVYTGRSIPASAAAEIDRKTDDGNPYTGSFRTAWQTRNSGQCSNANGWLGADGGSDCGGVTLY